jgi:dolichol-phosphate mannosyltransferase
MMKLAVDAIASTTSVPLVWPVQVFLGVSFVFGLSVVGQGITFFVLTIDTTLQFLWLMTNIILFMFVLLFFVLSILSLYLSRVFIETQNRPFYVIDQVIAGRP